ncbi:hypothetical protein RYX36_032464 [Vicia faba]
MLGLAKTSINLVLVVPIANLARFIFFLPLAGGSPTGSSINATAVVSLCRLNLLMTSFTEGFKSNQIESIMSSCPNPEHLLVACTFNLRYIKFVGDETLLALASNCSKLSLLHMADTLSFSNRREEDDGKDASGCKPITEKGLKTMTCLLRKTLIDVKVASCVNLDTAATLRASKHLPLR